MIIVSEQKRVKFNLNLFVEKLSYSLTRKEEEERTFDEDYESTEDILDTYKSFLLKTGEPLLSTVKDYVANHPLILENPQVEEFINLCYK